MKINFNNPNPGKWFEFDEDTAICVRVANDKFLKQLEKAPVDKKDEATWDYCIVDWKCLLDEEGNDIPCTKENKIKLMNESTDFMMTINTLVNQLGTEIKERKERLEKNLSST